MRTSIDNYCLPSEFNELREGVIISVYPQGVLTDLNNIQIFILVHLLMLYCRTGPVVSISSLTTILPICKHTAIVISHSEQYARLFQGSRSSHAAYEAQYTELKVEIRLTPMYSYNSNETQVGMQETKPTIHDLVKLVLISDQVFI